MNPLLDVLEEQRKLKVLDLRANGLTDAQMNEIIKVVAETSPEC